ncbi:carbohydrate-binding protein [uncultured Gemella sp.]|uniref:carbohydrate-binding protein n=1 Tax=uncultured Gemella sp. TaxID=254352 RepID=UPI0028EFA2E5|nr:carbohydrate-binding protein [uncultured Gemella sp.]
MALEISVKQPNPTAGGYKSVNVYFNMNTGGIYFNGNVELPGKFATANDAEILEEIRKQIAVQMYTGEATPALVAEYANLNKQVGILTGNKQDTAEREKALTKFANKVNKGNDKVIMALLLNVLDPKTINAKKDVIINAFDSYEVNVDYSVGDKFKHENKLYEVIEDHTSVVEWIPGNEPTKYKEITFERTENKEQLEDDNNRYITKLQLDDALTKVVQTIMEQLSQDDEGEENHDNHGENSNTISHGEGDN